VDILKKSFGFNGKVYKMLKVKTTIFKLKYEILNNK